MPEQTDEKKKLQLTDTPNVAQVIGLVNDMLAARRWDRRLMRLLRKTFRPIERKQEAAAVVSIDKARDARRRIDAAGKVVVE